MRPIATVAILLWPVACAHGSSVQKLGGETYRVSCPEQALDKCLAETASNACDKRAYFVERGISDVNLRGRSEAPDVATSSEAVIRCAPGRGWGDQAKELMATTPAPSASTAPPPTPAPRPPICAPGATQVCVGTGACSGGQACKADGSGYEPCDCGKPEPATADSVKD